MVDENPRRCAVAFENTNRLQWIEIDFAADIDLQGHTSRKLFRGIAPRLCFSVEYLDASEISDFCGFTLAQRTPKIVQHCVDEGLALRLRKSDLSLHGMNKICSG